MSLKINPKVCGLRKGRKKPLTGRNTVVGAGLGLGCGDEASELITRHSEGGGSGPCSTEFPV